MNRKPLYVWILPLAAVVVGVGLAGCGDDPSPASASTGGTGGATQDSPAKIACESFCVKEQACDPETTLDDCKQYRCGDLNGVTMGCQNALKAYFDCANALADPCVVTSCASLESLYRQAC